MPVNINNICLLSIAFVQNGNNLNRKTQRTVPVCYCSFISNFGLICMSERPGSAYAFAKFIKIFLL